MSRLERLLAELFEQKVREIGVSPTPPSPSVLRRVRRRQAVALMSAIVVLGAVTVGSVAGAQALWRATQRLAGHVTPAPHRGGSVVVGTREFPECLNPITACASAPGTWWTVLQHVMPRAMELDDKGNFVPSPLLVGTPSLRIVGAGLFSPGFSITYRLNPSATWADGSPITSADFDFTWRAFLSTAGAYTTAGYAQITSIDASEPKTAVITFKSVYIDWPDLFGGAAGGLLEKAAFPKYLNDPTPDLANEMQTDIPFSGGPWVLKSFAYPGKAVLIRNEHYFGKRPLLDQVTVLPLTDTPAAVSLLKDGTVEAFPWPGVEGLLDQFSGDRNIRAIAASGFGVEALWFNHASPPLDDPKVREALMYAIDRQGVIDQIVSRIDPGAQVLDCGFVAVPNMGPWCQTTPFAPFTYDQEKAKQILESDGYNCSTVPCTKGGERLVVDYSTVSTNERRVQVQQFMKDRALPAGFYLRIKNYDSGTRFDDIGPRGRFTMADYTQLAAPDPSVTGALSCKNIPLARNGFAGGNWTHWCVQKADVLMHLSDHELQPEVRLQQMDLIYAIEARDFLSLPLYVEPEMAAWRTDRIAGPIGDFAGSLNGLFFNMSEWYLAGR